MILQLTEYIHKKAILVNYNNVTIMEQQPDVGTLIRFNDSTHVQVSDDIMSIKSVVMSGQRCCG